MNDLPVVDPADHDPLLKVHNMRLRKSYVDGNSKILDFAEGVPCPRCHLPMDSGEEKPCKYCSRGGLLE